MTTKYLNDTGLAYFFGKLKALFATKDVATQSTDGLLSASDKTKLDGLDQLVDSGSGTSVTVTADTYIESVIVHGKSVQSGTPTPSVPVDIQVVEPVNGTFGISVDGATTPIDLQGNVLAGLPDGTTDVLTIDSVGHCVLTKNVGVIEYDGDSSESWTRYNFKNGYGYYTSAIDISAVAQSAVDKILCNRFIPHGANNVNFTNGKMYIDNSKHPCFAYSTISSVSSWRTFLASSNIVLYYRLATPQTIDLGYIDIPKTANGSQVSIVAAVTPTIEVSWWTVFAEPIANAIKYLKDLLLQQS